jgi:DNA-binding CsgD family transcriptional regulator
MVQSHVNHIYAKTGSRNKVELANALRASAKEEP